MTRPRSARRLLLAILVLAMAGLGCRSMPSAPRPVADSATYHAATELDPESHVLSITVHAPTVAWDYSSPRGVTQSTLRGTAGELVQAAYETCTGRTFGFHMFGHVMIELKTTDPATGVPRYVLTASTDDTDREILDLIVRQQIGYSVVDRPIAGHLQRPDEVARDLDESAELGIRSARLRVLLSPAAAERMLRFLDEIQRRGIPERYSLTAYPLVGDGSGCTSFAVSLLDVAGLLDPAWRDGWRVSRRVPEALFGDPEQGVRVPARLALFGPDTFRWATAEEPHRCVSFYDTTAMYRWIVTRAGAPGFTSNDPVTRRIACRLALPVVTVDRRLSPTPTGPIFTTLE